MVWEEVIVGILYVVLALGLGFLLKSKMTDPNTKKYFIFALLVKLIGGISVGLIYYYYYGGGDTVTYYTHGAQHIYNAFKESPYVGLQLIFGDNVQTIENLPFSSRIWVFRDNASYFCVRFAGFFNLLSFNTYAGTVVFFAFLSFLAVWRLYQFMTTLYPSLTKQFAISFLFLPSVFFWGSGILKDTITFAFLCLFIHAALIIYFEKKNIILNSIILVMCAFFIAKIKIYILIAIVPALAFLFLFGPIKSIKNQLVKTLLTPFILVLSTSVGIMGIRQVGEMNTEYSLDNMAQTAEKTARWIHYVSVTDGGSGYSLGDYDFSAFGIIKKTIPAIWVSLFRPHPWEARNPVMVFSALEALFFLYLFFRVYFTNIRYTRKAQSFSILIPFFLIFSVIFAWAVGLTTYNFGTLVRYKIPMMPFFISALFILDFNKKAFKKMAT